MPRRPEELIGIVIDKAADTPNCGRADRARSSAARRASIYRSEPAAGDGTRLGVLGTTASAATVPNSHGLGRAASLLPGLDCRSRKNSSGSKRRHPDKPRLTMRCCQRAMGSWWGESNEAR